MHAAIRYEHYLLNRICKQLVELDFSPVIKCILRYLPFVSTVPCRCRRWLNAFLSSPAIFDLRRFCNFVAGGGGDGDCYLTACAQLS